MEKVACIEIAGNRKVNLSNIESITCLMNRPALPIRNITWKTKEGSEGVTTYCDDDDNSVEAPIRADETLGETLKRMKKGETLKDAMQRRGSTREGDIGKRRQVAQPKKLPPKQPLQQNKKKAISNTTEMQDDSQSDRKQAAKPKITSKHTRSVTSPPQLPQESLRPPSSAVADGTDAPLSPSGKDEQGIRQRKIKNRLQEKLRASLSLRREHSIDFEFDANAFFGDAVESPEPSQVSEMQGPVDHGRSPALHRTAAAVGKKNSYTKKKKRREKDMHESGEQQASVKSCLRRRSSLEPINKTELTAASIRMSSSLDASLAVPDQEGSFSTEDAKKVFGGGHNNSRDALCDSATSMCSEDDSIQSQKVFRPSLRWGSIDIREYSQCLGDNPACAKGVPLQLDWDYTTLGTVSLDDFERVRAPTRESAMSLRISSSYRQELMFKLGYTASDMAAVNRVKLRDQKRRIQTVARLKYVSFGERMEQMVKIFPTAQRAN